MTRYCDEGGLFKFPGLEQYSFLDGIYIDITQKRAQDEANDDSFTKKNFNISAGFLVFFRDTESIVSGLDYVY
jgi:hypothetical protein